MNYFLLLILAVASFINSQYHLWQVGNGDLELLILVVGAIIIREIRKNKAPRIGG
jgi:hypothetical protein